MKAKEYLYAAVGAPVIAARKVGERVDSVKSKMAERKTAYGKSAEKTLDGWAVEGEKIVSKVSEGKVVEEISAKVDLDQAKEQVGKLRDQLEDMLATWRQSFRPEKATEKDEVKATTAPKAPAAKKPAAKKPAAKATTAKKPATKTSAAKTTKSSTAAKTSSTKPASEKKAS